MLQKKPQIKEGKPETVIPNFKANGSFEPKDWIEGWVFLTWVSGLQPVPGTVYHGKTPNYKKWFKEPTGS